MHQFRLYMTYFIPISSLFTIYLLNHSHYLRPYTEAATEFAISLVQTLVMHESGVISSLDLYSVIDALGKVRIFVYGFSLGLLCLRFWKAAYSNFQLALRPGSPESLQQLVEVARNSTNNASSLQGFMANKEDKTRQSRDKKVVLSSQIVYYQSLSYTFFYIWDTLHLIFLWYSRFFLVVSQQIERTLMVQILFLRILLDFVIRCVMLFLYNIFWINSSYCGFSHVIAAIISFYDKQLYLCLFLLFLCFSINCDIYFA